VPETSKKPDDKVSFWNDPQKRGIFFQIIAAFFVGAFFYYIVNNALTNMEQRGITTGFGFFDKESGFAILQSLIPYSETDTYGRTFFVGLLNTALVAILGIFCATILGFSIGIARLSNNWLVSKLASTYIEIFRNIPLLLQIFFWYFAVLQSLPAPRQSLNMADSFFLNVRGLYIPGPILESGFSVVGFSFLAALIGVFFLRRYAKKRQAETGDMIPVGWYSLLLVTAIPGVCFLIMGMPLSWEYPALTGFNFTGGITIIPELFALLLALTIYTGAFIAEVVRSGIEAIPDGQTEAASALGLSEMQRIRLVIIPQAMRVIIPPLTNQYLNLTKNSSLATAIGYPDLVSVFMGTTLNQTGQAIEIIFMTMGVYLTFSLTTSFFMNWYNRHVALVER